MNDLKEINSQTVRTEFIECLKKRWWRTTSKWAANLEWKIVVCFLFYSYTHRWMLPDKISWTDVFFFHFRFINVHFSPEKLSFDYICHVKFQKLFTHKNLDIKKIYYHQNDPMCELKANPKKCTKIINGTFFHVRIFRSL